MKTKRSLTRSQSFCQL